jgi:hypothetical protein
MDLHSANPVEISKWDYQGIKQPVRNMTVVCDIGYVYFCVGCSSWEVKWAAVSLPYNGFSRAELQECEILLFLEKTFCSLSFKKQMRGFRNMLMEKQSS